MKIQSIFCDGYGLFSQLLLSDIPGGLILFTGLNESGKTTLMEFLRTVLFGPPGRSNHRNEYLPLRGGNHGGRIRVVSHTHGTFLIEWNPSHWIITDPGGKKIDPPSFREILGNIDRQTYERIFAIGLADLQGLDVLKGEAVKARLLAASSGLGATSFPETLKNLDKEMLDLLKKSAQKPEINQFLIQLRDLQTAIKSLQGETKDYGILQSKLDHLKKITREKRTDEETIRSQIQHLENLEKAWEPWIRLSSAREKKVTWDFSAAFPPQGLERLENIKKESEELQGRKKTLEETEERFRKEKEFLVGFEKIISLKNDITMLTGEREKFTSSLEYLPHLREKRGRTEEVLQKRLQDLGP
ncbi:MAG: AAA family ATPase, partial [Candidatus Atribacteria bacterium]|nr:AAA family ATPase [Candidatus Atribacteria bacterium]